jgi:hypothetical protein
MKRAVIVMLLVLAASADARRVIHIPTLAELCPGNDSWDRVAQCIRRQSSFQLERDAAAIKVVNIAPGMAGRHSLSGIYVYRFDKKWTLHGVLRVYQPRELLRFERITFGAHTGYRLDVGITTNMPFSFDDETMIPGVLRQQLTLLCFDEGGCQQIVTACDLLVHGKAYASFRGTLRYVERQLRVVGDRRHAGAMCAQPELVLTD